MLFSYSLVTLLWAMSLVQARTIQRRSTECRNYATTFSESHEGWYEEDGRTNTWEVTEEGIKMKLLPPKEYVPLLDWKTDNNTPLPYNKYVGTGPTFNATHYMKYGTFSASIKSANVGGAVTAVILIADNGDEIDFELLGGPGGDVVQTNYFYGDHIVYGENGGEHKVNAGPISDTFYNYTVVWTPEYIQWFVNGKLERTKYKEETFINGRYEYPMEAARVQIGLWDGSGSSGTAQWAQGPINWSEHTEINAYIKDVTVKCNEDSNKIIN
ncbi:concanavalin A-like lectin/glucanase domain-containing protein [Pilobolus umbonatus]|nr:concanavalin A-like lectin/glucanase domain-containing protein [Pilobolus umbonatus]